MLVLVFMTDKETLAEQVYSELALERRKENIMQLIQNNDILQNIYIYTIYYIKYIIYVYIHVDILNWSCFWMTNIYCLHDNSFWLNAPLHNAALGILCHHLIFLFFPKKRKAPLLCEGVKHVFSLCSPTRMSLSRIQTLNLRAMIYFSGFCPSTYVITGLPTTLLSAVHSPLFNS